MFFSALILCLVLPTTTTTVLIEYVVVDEMTDGQSGSEVEMLLLFSVLPHATSPVVNGKKPKEAEEMGKMSENWKPGNGSSRRS